MPRYNLERHNCEDGSITWEVWDYDPSAYRRICKVNDSDNKHALADMRLVTKALNDSGAQP